MMNFRRFSLLLATLLLLPAVWFSAPLWLSKVAEEILVQQQCSEVVVDIDGVGWTQSHINRLYCKDQKGSFEMDLTDAEISYTFAGLMEKQIEHLSLGRVELKVRSSSEAKAEFIPALTTPALLLESLPLSSFNVRNIHLQRQNQQGEVTQELMGYATYSDQGLSVELKEESYLNGVQLKLEMNRANGVSAWLSQGEASILQVVSTMRNTADGLSVDGEIDIELAPLSVVLKPWLNMSESSLEGLLHGSWQLSLPVRGSKSLLQQLNLRAALDLDFALHRPDSGASRGKVNLNLAFKQGLGSWDIIDGSQLTFGDKEEMSAGLSDLSGTFTLAESGWSVAIAEKSKLQLKNVHFNNIGISYAQVSFIKPLEVARALNATVTIAQEAAVEVLAPKIEGLGVNLISQNIRVVIKPGSLLSPSGSFNARAITLSSQLVSLPESNVSGRFDLSDKLVSIVGNMHAKKHGIQLNWQLSHLFSESAWNITIAEKSKLHAKDIHIGGKLIPYVKIRALRPIEVAIRQKGAVKFVNKTLLSVVLAKLKWQGNTLASRGVELTLDRGSILSPSGSFVANGVRLAFPSFKLPESRVAGTFDLSEKQVSAFGKVDAQEAGIQLGWKLKYQKAEQKGLLEFAFEPLIFGVEGADLSRVVDDHGDYAIERGEMNFNGSVQWQGDQQTQEAKMDVLFDLKLSDLKGFYKANQFSGFDGDLHFTGNEDRLVMAPAVVTLDKLHASLPVNNISMRAAFVYPFAGLASIQIDQLKAETLGGQVSSEDVSIDFARASNPFLVYIKHMDAGKLAEIRRQEGLQVQGLLDGALPFDWTSDGLKMTAGALQSGTAGGLIRYMGTESVRKLATTDHATKMVMDIMNNFHYKLLKVGADYSPDGELKLQINLQGNNPEYEQGRTVDFNFNIEENILTLMQGLRMSGNISDALEKKVQKKLRKQ